MSTTAIDLKLGLNIEIGSVPVSLNAEVQTDDKQSVYSFNGCMQSAEIDIGTFMTFVGQQFAVDVQLPPELNLKAIIDYIAGQVIYTAPKDPSAAKTTELGAAAKFDLIYTHNGKTDSVTFTFYADTILKKGATQNNYVVGGAIDTNLQFKNLPLVGDVPVFNEYTLKHLGFSYTNADPAATEPVKFNIPKVTTAPNPLSTLGTGKDAKTYSIDNSGNETTFSLAKKGFAFTAGLMREGSDTKNFALPMALPDAPPTIGPASYYKSEGAVQASPPATPIHWIDINKTFGPITLQKVGVNYASGEATFGFSAGFALAGFAMELQGLSITFPLPLPGMPAGNTLSFDLEGLGMMFTKGNITIGGAFLKVLQDEITNYYGEVIVQVAAYGFKALGGYAPAQKGQPASFFLYASLEAPLGGPPFLYVSGLAFGFGINRTLILPNIDTLPGYLLLPNNAPAQGATPTATITEVMPKMAVIFRNQPGQYWVAAGIQFTSFDLVSAFALATVSFGVDLEIGLLGAVSVSLPRGVDPPLAYIEIDLIAAFRPAVGLLSVEGVIAPTSYLMGDFVKLTGGFAFYIWFSGEHKGDFVVTLGGYHPAFKKPDWYPAVPRLGLSFALGPFKASGSAYVALMPSMFMAGLQFQATFEAGPIKAWFKAGANFLVGWAPLLYEADAYVSIGCAVNLGLFTISVSVGADLMIWGPPFGGKAHVDLDVVSFTISFGSESPAPAPVSWENIEKQFLPKATRANPEPHTMRMARITGHRNSRRVEDADATANVSASVATGLIRKDFDGYDWILDPNTFEIVTATTIPANVAQWTTGDQVNIKLSNNPNDYGVQPVDVQDHPYLELAAGIKPYDEKNVWNPTVHIRPMKLKKVQSIHTIGVSKGGGYINTLAIEPVLESSNTALWGDPDVKDDANTATLLPKTLLGFMLIPLPRNPNTVNNVLLYQLLYTQGNRTSFDYTKQQPNPDYTVSSNIGGAPAYDLNMTVGGHVSKSFKDKDYVLSTLIDTWVAGQRQDILNDLAANGFETITEVHLDGMGKTEQLTDWPLVGLLGATI